MNCCVIDDEPLAAGLIASYITKTPFLNLGGTFHSAQEAVKAVVDARFDLVFLDIKMPQLNGLEFAHLIPPSTKIIFTTAFDNHAIEAFHVGASDYLLKPVSYEEFLAAVNRVRERMQITNDSSYIPGEATTSTPDHILIKNNHKLEQIAVADILFIEGLKDYVKIITKTGRKVVTLSSMRALEKFLPATRFMRVHRSFIVNTAHIISIERNRLTMTDNTQIPVGDSYRQVIADYVSSHNAL